MVATLHLLSAIDNAGYFGGMWRTTTLPGRGVRPAYDLAPDGTVTVREEPGLGIEVDEAFIAAHPLIDDPATCETGAAVPPRSVGSQA